MNCNKINEKCNVHTLEKSVPPQGQRRYPSFPQSLQKIFPNFGLEAIMPTDISDVVRKAVPYTTGEYCEGVIKNKAKYENDRLERNISSGLLGTCVG